MSTYTRRLGFSLSVDSGDTSHHAVDTDIHGCLRGPYSSPLLLVPKSWLVSVGLETGFVYLLRYLKIERSAPPWEGPRIALLGRGHSGEWRRGCPSSGPGAGRC